MGWFIVQAEPAVHVLNKQVEEITSGAIPGKAMSTSLSIGVAVSIGLAMMRVMTGISIFWLVVPGYLAAIVMSFFVPKIDRQGAPMAEGNGHPHLGGRLDAGKLQRRK